MIPRLLVIVADEWWRLFVALARGWVFVADGMQMTVDVIGDDSILPSGGARCAMITVPIRACHQRFNLPATPSR